MDPEKIDQSVSKYLTENSVKVLPYESAIEFVFFLDKSGF